ncbi:DUF4232 domain-containing protein [Streptomyces vinaceus]|uniref:DUF4232 domain-containing protein n=1 Tax=Streptomyces vinaceus TaxID=1960 RepID=A0A5J6J9K4_STRVI|nr:DUF4232 domain-containing protein [Streptomyces vinaceus]QEV46863.1 DUF4232 domain-containing protein [Streptomyces vinaceus]GHE59117.1 hypothetical protein GCM10017778_49480 [Streptomyces vinaceus]
MTALRTTRTTRRLAGAAAVALAALALTACQNGTGLKDGGAATASDSSTASPSPTGATSPAPGTPAPGSTKTGTGTGKGTGSGQAKGGSSDPAAAAGNHVLCNGSNTEVTVQPVARPLNHMLISVKNTGSKSCDLTYYPVLRFDEMQWAPAPRQETRPQAVVSLAPGQSGHAAAMLAAADGSGEGGTTGQKLTIAFQGRTPNSSGGASATPPLPAKGIYYDSSLTVTYWQQNIEDALGS